MPPGIPPSLLPQAFAAFINTLTFSERLAYSALRSKALTAVPHLALTPRPPLLKHSAQYAPPLKRIIMTVTMSRPYKTIVIIPPSSAIAHHALKSPDSLFERNSNRSRKIATAPCRAKKLEKCHVKHFPRIKSQAFHPYLSPIPTTPRKSATAPTAPLFMLPDRRRRSRRHKQSIALHAVAGNPLCHNNSLGMPRPKTASILPKYEQIWQSDQNSPTAYSMKKSDYKQHARHITQSRTKSITAL